jgi:hypothetical protein
VKYLRNDLRPTTPIRLVMSDTVIDGIVIDANVLATIFVGIISTAAVLIIGIYSNSLLKKQFESNEKQHREQLSLSKSQQQVEFLLQAFRILDTEQHRNSRTRVYVSYFDYLDTGELKSFKGSADVQTLRADFDLIGKLVESESIEKEEFLEEYGSLAYRCWKCLEADINDERDSRNFKPFMTYFQWLANEAFQYWKDKGEDLSMTKLYNPYDPTRWVDFQQK